ncbi:MAG TPA: heat-inducible transcription repressor HrcA [Acholeplasma sp.]|jgi:heat-inducible transcriptional repressor|nr:heat-inducible transcription repressor HrcA [Acholeplasma sp.]
MLSSRQKLILKAVIETYVKDAVPVGSKYLTQLPHLNFSSATIRYDMQVLEELGFLEKTHTSSGRIPSEKGYRYYVDHLFTRNEDVVDTFPLIDKVFDRHKLARERAVEEAIRLLSDLTNYTALAVGPSGEDSIIKRIDFIPLSDKEAVILIVTDKGQVQHQNIRIPEEITMSHIKEVITTLDDLLKDKYLEDASKILQLTFAKKEVMNLMEYQVQLIDSFISAFSKFAEENFYLSGLTNVFDEPEFTNVKRVKQFVDMLDRRELIKLIGKNERLTVKFASDIEVMPLANTTVISIPYRISETEHGTIAVLGPTRMEYSRVIPLLEYIASNIGKLYKK